MAVKLFINYAEKDKAYWDALNTHLNILKRNNVITDYSSDQIMPGQLRTDEMHKHLHSADIILLLISSDLMADDDTYNLIEKALETNKTIVPILVRSCSGWKDMEKLKDLKALPANEVPINKWQDADEAYEHVIEELKKIIAHTKQQQTDIASQNPKPQVTPLLLNKKYTCDRTGQRDLFDEHLDEHKKNQKVFFYVIQGEEIQSPNGLYRCLRDRDLLHNLKIEYVKTFEEEISVEPKNTLKRSQSQLIDALCDVWQQTAVPDHDPEQLTLLNLLHAPAIKGHSVVSTCLYIDTLEWNDNIPAVADWFVNHFCKVQLNSHAPTFIFFIILDYESKEKYKEFLQYFEPLQQKETFCLLPVLDPVKHEDINIWLKKAGMGDVERRKELLLQQLHIHKVSDQTEINMQKVEKILADLITQYNAELTKLDKV